MPVPPSTPTFPAGYGPLPSDFDSWVQSPLAFCAAKTVLRVSQPAGGQSIPASTYTVVSFPTVLEDPYSGWSTSATGSQPANSYLAPFDGWYDVTFTLALGSGTTHVEPTLYLSSTSYYEMSAVFANSSTSAVATGSFKVPMIGGSDYLQARIYTTAALSTAASASRLNSLEIVYVSE